VNNLAKREKLLVILGGGAIIFYLYYSIFLSPIITSITNERKVIASKNIEVASIERLKITNVSNRKKLDEYVKKFEDAIKQLPKTDRNPEIAYNLNGLATKSNITIDSVSFGAISDYVETTSTENTTKEGKEAKDKTSTASTTSQKLKLVPVSISVTGDYASFLSFVSSIETIEADNRLAEIGNINISAKTDGGNSVQAAISLNYYFSEGTTKEQPTYDNLKDNNVGKDNLFN
jgi:type IV pilus assembly protein PilO